MSEREGVEAFFDSNVEDYEAKHYRGEVRSFMTVRQRRVLEFVDGLRLPRGTRTLDAGCGPGYLLEALAARGLQVSGMDASSGMLRRAEARVEAAGPEFPVTLKVGDIEHLPFQDGSFDLVTSTGVIEYLKADATVLGELLRVLRPGGHLILPVTNIWSPINAFDGLIEFMKRREWFRRPFNLLWERLGQRPLLPRHFRVRKHRPAELRRALTAAGFTLEDGLFFFFLPWPRPFDRLAPRASALLGGWMEERLARSWLGRLAEGYLTLSGKPLR